MLDRLIDLANDVSAEGRRQLLHAVTDLFLVEAAPRPAVTEDFSDIAQIALKGLASRDRAAYAERVSIEAALPRAVAKTLATDPDFAVASLVLRLSPVLTDADLAAIAVTHSPDHLVAIAERATLPETITDVLVERGNDTVLRKVTANEGAKFSDRGLTGLLARCGSNPPVLENLLRRAKELPAIQVQRLQAIASRVRPNSDKSKSSAYQPQRREAQQRRLEVKLLITEVQRGERTLDEAVMLLASEDRAFDLAHIVGTIAGIPDAQVLKALLEPDVSGIAVACRSVGLQADGFKAILGLRTARLGSVPKQIERDLESYGDLPQSVSEHAMRFLKVRMKVA
jgi:hypothetical protein